MFTFLQKTLGRHITLWLDISVQMIVLAVWRSLNSKDVFIRKPHSIKFLFCQTFFQSFAGNKSLVNVSVREQLHLAASKYFQTEIFLGYATNRRSWITSLTFDFSRTLACARTTFLAADEVADNLCIWCRSCRSRSAAGRYLFVCQFFRSFRCA